MKFLVLFFALAFTLVKTSAQDCLGMKFKAGSSYEMLSYSPKDKIIGRMVYTIKEVKSEGGSTLIDVTMQSFDEKDKPSPEMAVRYTCNGNELIADLSGLLLATNDGLKDMEVKVKANQLIYPKELGTGSKLPDGNMAAELYSKGTKMMDMDFQVVNRAVEGQENLTTPAGQFSVSKINSEINMTNRAMGIPIRATFRSTSYRASQVLFDIKTETYNKNGKLKGYTVLSKLSQ
ncbi:hypothetical protein ACFPMF_16720 [Larkinella bovis]|uniref:DUF3108 domain-containing protein n=1 Tax=Larkinella bovis TaxID=683041 RepID=A0ABW0IBT7_9BACT